MRLQPLRQIFIRTRTCEPLAVNDSRAEKAQHLLKAAIATDVDVRCVTCDRKLRGLTGAYFVVLAKPLGDESMGVACSDICLRRAKIQGVP